MNLRYMENRLQQLCYSYKYKKAFGVYTHFIALNKLSHDPRLTLKERIWVDIPTVKQPCKAGVK